MSTMAHEYQHLLCMSNAVKPFGDLICNTWLNEAVSGYIEEYIYPGIMEESGQLGSIERSFLIKNGQSMYNFTTSVEEDEYDNGVYGSVFLFSQYLTDTYGGDVFKKIHSYWRESTDRGLDTVEVLYAVASDAVRDQVSNSYSYPAEITLKDKEEIWMSKLILNFYMSLIASDVSDKITPDYLLYDDFDPAKIEGGGRIIVNTKDNTFTIPEDSDYGLIFIGLDENFKPVSAYIYK